MSNAYKPREARSAPPRAGGFACLISRRILSRDRGEVGTTPAHQLLRARKALKKKFRAASERAQHPEKDLSRITRSMEHSVGATKQLSRTKVYFSLTEALSQLYQQVASATALASAYSCKWRCRGSEFTGPVSLILPHCLWLLS